MTSISYLVKFSYTECWNEWFHLNANLVTVIYLLPLLNLTIC